MSWFYLCCAILFEVAGTTSMKLSEGFTKLVPSIALFFFYGLCFFFFTMAVKKLEISVTYPIWSGVGTALIAVVGVMYFNESMSVLKLVSMLLIIVGVFGLSASS